jgi:hypothetical protein
MWYAHLKLLKNATGCGAGRLVAAALTLPAGWWLSGLFCLAYLPFLLFYFAVFVVSLRH